MRNLFLSFIFLAVAAVAQVPAGFKVVVIPTNQTANLLMYPTITASNLIAAGGVTNFPTEPWTNVATMAQVLTNNFALPVTFGSTLALSGTTNTMSMTTTSFVWTIQGTNYTFP